MKHGVLLLAHGAPERLEDIPEYLTNIRGGRPMAPAIVEEIRRRYAEIGGGSPLLARTCSQAQALAAHLKELDSGAEVYFGMRNWHPFIRETMARMKADGVRKIVAVCLAPQYSKFSVGLYFRRVQEAKQELGMDAEIVWTKTFHSHPMLIEAFFEKLSPLLPAAQVLFTAHSLPEKILEKADPYDNECRATARAVAERAGLTDWDFAYQSQGMTDEKWLGPTVESRLDAYAANGVKRCVLAPIGFVSDHVEVLYDVDILFKGYARRQGIDLVRPDSLNDSPKLIDAVARVALGRL